MYTMAFVLDFYGTLHEVEFQENLQEIITDIAQVSCKDLAFFLEESVVDLTTVQPDSFVLARKRSEFCQFCLDQGQRSDISYTINEVGYCVNCIKNSPKLSVNYGHYFEFRKGIWKEISPEQFSFAILKRRQDLIPLEREHEGSVSALAAALSNLAPELWQELPKETLTSDLLWNGDVYDRNLRLIRDPNPLDNFHYPFGVCYLETDFDLHSFLRQITYEPEKLKELLLDCISGSSKVYEIRGEGVEDICRLLKSIMGQCCSNRPETPGIRLLISQEESRTFDKGATLRKNVVNGMWIRKGPKVDADEVYSALMKMI